MIRYIFAAFVFFASFMEGSEPFERFVGLGSCCVTRTQINRHLTTRFGTQDLSIFGGGQLFDWLIIYDYRKLAEAIENNLSDLFDRSDLIVEGKEYPVVKNHKYLMTRNHLFTRNPDQTLPANVLELEYDSRKQKINYLSKKFRDLRNFRTLYIIAFPYRAAKNRTVASHPRKRLGKW